MTAPIGPSLELQGKINGILLADANLKTLIGDPPRVFIDPPEGSWPGAYITIGEDQTVDDSDQCLRAAEIYPTIHVWSQTTTFTEAKKVAASVIAALHNATIAMAENRMFSIMLDRGDTMRDPDGVTKHIALTFKARVETPV